MENNIIKQIARYYVKGLTTREIGKLLDLNARTIQRYIKANDIRAQIKEPKPTKAKALDLVRRGFSYAATAKRLKVSKTSVYLWAKQAKTAALQS